MSTLADTSATVAAALAERLAAAGVARAFGFPGGGSNLDLVDALERAGVEFVLTHTEVAAAVMATATAEMTGAPGVVIVGNGPGLASVVNGVAQAHLDRVPLLVISDRYTEAESETTEHQILDQRAILAPLVKWSETLAADTAVAAIEHALAVCLSAPAGAVHLDVPRTLAATAVVPGDDDEPADEAPSDPAPSPAADAELAAIAAQLEAARRPLILVGLEANASQRRGALQELAERLGAPVLTTYKAKGTLPELHPLWAGVLTGGTIEDPLLARADVILAVGLDPVELLAKRWIHHTPVLALRTSTHNGDYLTPLRTWVGDVGAAVAALGEHLSPAGNRGWPLAEIAAHRTGALERLRLDRDAPLTGWKVVEAVADELPADATVSVDAGAHMFAATSFWRSTRPRRFLISSGLATMGFAVPAAVAAARARPGEVSVAFTGDGGTAYHVFELETAVRLSLRPIVVVLNDSSLSLIRIKHEAKGYDRRQLDFGPIDFARVAEGLGAHGHVVADEGELRAAARAALAADRPTLIDARIAGGEWARTFDAIRG